MAPECVEVYLKWNLAFYLENLIQLRPPQDLPSFSFSNDIRKKMLNDKNLDMNVVISRKKI